MLIAIIETSSRGNFLAFALGSTLILKNYFWNKNSSSSKSSLFIILTILFVIFIYTLAPMFTDNIGRMTDFEGEADNGRFSLWTNSIDVWKKNILLGGGFGAVLLSGNLASHSLYFQVLAETGLLGLVLLVCFLYLIFQHANSYNPLYGAIILALLFQAAFINTLDNRCFWAILGWILLMPTRMKRNYKISKYGK